MAKWRSIYDGSLRKNFASSGVKITACVYRDSSWAAFLNGAVLCHGVADTPDAAKSAVIDCIQGELLKALRETGWEEK